MQDYSVVAATLGEPLAQELLHSSIPARFAFAAKDGTPRVTPIWFHWTGQSLVFASRADSAKVIALRRRPEVAVSIDSETWPYKVLRMRGRVVIEEVAGGVEEYARAALRYYGKTHSQRWLQAIGFGAGVMARMTLTPEWAKLEDFRKVFDFVDWD